MLTFKSKHLFITFGILLFLILSVFSVATLLCKSSETRVLSAQAVDQAASMSAAQSALEAMQRGDTEVAKLTLEDQIRQGLVILRKTEPELSSRNALSEQDRKIIDDSLRDADKYASEHHLVVPPP